MAFIFACGCTVGVDLSCYTQQALSVVDRSGALQGVLTRDVLIAACSRA
jgi:hypothetical protein